MSDIPFFTQTNRDIMVNLLFSLLLICLTLYFTPVHRKMQGFRGFFYFTGVVSQNIQLKSKRHLKTVDLQNVEDQHCPMLIPCHILSKIPSESHAMWALRKRIQLCRPACRDSS